MCGKMNLYSFFNKEKGKRVKGKREMKVYSIFIFKFAKVSEKLEKKYI